MSDVDTINRWNKWLEDSDYVAVIGNQVDHSDHAYDWASTVGGYYVEEQPLCCHTCQKFVLQGTLRGKTIRTVQVTLEVPYNYDWDTKAKVDRNLRALLAGVGVEVLEVEEPQLDKVHE